MKRTWREFWFGVVEDIFIRMTKHEVEMIIDIIYLKEGVQKAAFYPKSKAGKESPIIPIS